MPKLLLVIGLICGLVVSGSALAQSCNDVRQKSGGAAEQKCLFDEQEAVIKQQLSSYKIMIDRTKETIKAHYESEINGENFSWKEIDLRMKMEEEDRKYLIAQLGTAKESAEQAQKEKNLLIRLQRIRSLASAVHGKKVSRMQKLRESELANYDSALVEYELQLRQQQMPRL